VDNERTNIRLFLFSHESSITNKKMEVLSNEKKRYLKSLKYLIRKFLNKLRKREKK